MNTKEHISSLLIKLNEKTARSIFLLYFSVFIFLFLGSAFVTLWKDLEKKSRARRFCLFILNFSLIYCAIEKHAVKVKSIIFSLFVTVVCWLLSYFYNLMEYSILLPLLMVFSLVVSYTLKIIYAFKFNTEIFLIVKKAYFILFSIALFILVPCAIYFIWNRKKHMKVYKIVFACLVSFSAGVPVYLIAEGHLEHVIAQVIVAWLTAFVAYLGVKGMREESFRSSIFY